MGILSSNLATSNYRMFSRYVLPLKEIQLIVAETTNCESNSYTRFGRPIQRDMISRWEEAAHIIFNTIDNLLTLSVVKS